MLNSYCVERAGCKPASLIVGFHMLMLLLLSAAQAAEPTDAPLFSVMTVPATESGDHAQIAVKWSGELPVRLERGLDDATGEFTPLGPPIILSEAMSLLPSPAPDSGGSSWRVLDSQEQTLARTRTSAHGFGWQSEFFGPGLDGTVWATTVYEGELIVGGHFVFAGETVVNNIARWDGSQWIGLSGPLGTGVGEGTEVDGWVDAMTVYDGELIVGGQFTTAGGVTVNNIARWDGSQWADLSGPSGTGVNSRVWALTVYNGELIVGGGFFTAGGLSVNRIASWDGSQWAALSGPSGTGMNSDVRALTVHNEELIAGGLFTTAGGVTVNGISSWDGSQWTDLTGPSSTGLNGWGLTLTVFNDELIVGGNFDTAGGVAVDHIARWDGSQWAELSDPSSTGLNDWVTALTVYNGELIAGGDFTTAGGVTVNRIARWNGSQWADLSGPSSTGMSSGRVNALTVHNDELIASGSFELAGEVVANSIARWNGSKWAGLGGPSGTGIAMNGLVLSLIVYNGELIAGGWFTSAGGVAVNSIARWDGVQWADLGGPAGTGVSISGQVNALAVYKGELIAGGYFSTAGGVAVNSIARWNGSRWAELSGPSGVGTTGEVDAMTVYNGELIIGGGFNVAGGVNVSNIARWDGSQWADLSGPSGNGVSGGVSALSVYNGELIAGGGFATAGGVGVNRIARWDGSQWAELSGPSGTGVSGWVTALTVYNGELIASGDFSTAGGVTVNFIARWDGSQWAEFSDLAGTGLNSAALALTDYNGELIAGGFFTTAGGVTVNRIARWDGSRWAELSGPSGSGLNSIVRALTIYNADLFSGGDFSAAGGMPSWRIGRYVSPHTIGGTVSGLIGSGLMLQINDGDDLPIAADGPFTFPSPVANGSSYEVTVLTQPGDPSQTCTVSNGTGTVAGADVGDIVVTCIEFVFQDRFQ